MSGVERDRLIVYLTIPATDPTAAVRLIRQIDQVLRDVRTAVCSGWTSTDTGDPQPHLTAWLDLDCALVLTWLEPDQALLELRVNARPATGRPPGWRTYPAPGPALPPYR